MTTKRVGDKIFAFAVGAAVLVLGSVLYVHAKAVEAATRWVFCREGKT